VLDRLTADTFAPAVGHTFALDAGEAGELELTLLEARSRDAPSDSAVRTPFSLLFRGPAEPTLPQRIYRLRHPTIGTLEIFLVPIARDGDGTMYEAVFG
jgi:hypothetical protein